MSMSFYQRNTQATSILVNSGSTGATLEYSGGLVVTNGGGKLFDTVFGYGGYGY